MLPFDELGCGEFRLLDVDCHCVLPVGVEVRFVLSSRDVIHSWSVPSLGLKVDANPGYCSSLFSSLVVCGLYFGQCSELCGANHSFMPIVLEGVSPAMFVGWCLSGWEGNGVPCGASDSFV